LSQNNTSNNKIINSIRKKKYTLQGKKVVVPRFSPLLSSFYIPLSIYLLPYRNLSPSLPPLHSFFALLFFSVLIKYSTYHHSIIYSFFFFTHLFTSPPPSHTLSLFLFALFLVYVIFFYIFVKGTVSLLYSTLLNRFTHEKNIK